jgi:hypothetical protein
MRTTRALPNSTIADGGAGDGLPDVPLNPGLSTSTRSSRKFVNPASARAIESCVRRLDSAVAGVSCACELSEIKQASKPRMIEGTLVFMTSREITRASDSADAGAVAESTRPEQIQLGRATLDIEARHVQLLHHPDVGILAALHFNDIQTGGRVRCQAPVLAYCFLIERQ